VSSDGGRGRTTNAQQRILAGEWGFDEGGRYALLAVSGYEIAARGHDDFGTLFSIIDTDTGAEVEVAPLVAPVEMRAERRRMIGRVMHLNGKEDAFAA